MQTHVQAKSPRRVLVTVVALFTGATALAACRGDDVVPDVFVDPNHCARDPDAAPFGMCDVVAIDATDATATE
jgi:hypothetical protein